MEDRIPANCEVRARAGDSLLLAPLKRVLCVAHFQRGKGHEYLFHATAQLFSRGRRFFLDLAGRGPERADLEILANTLAIREYCWFRGMVPRAQMPALYWASTVVVLPSEWEGLGLALVEAAACGRPIIGVRGTGMIDIVQPGVNGFLVDPRDAEGLAWAIEKFL